MTSGIYKIEAPSGRFYIGSAQNLDHRWSQHRRQLREKTHGNCNLQRACEKYGLPNLKFSILLICSPESLLMYEQIAMDGLRPAYNIAPVAGSGRGIKRSVDFKKKVSDGGKGRVVSAETRAKIGAKHKGKKLSPEQIAIWRAGLSKVTIEQRRNAAKAMHTPQAVAKRAATMMGHQTSSETKKKISAALSGRPHSPERIAAIVAGQARRAAIMNGS